MTSSSKTPFGIVSLNRLLTAVSLTMCGISISGCAGSPTAPAIVAPTYIVSGVVFERTANGINPVEGIWVATASHGGRATDKNGFYSIPGLPRGDITLTASGSSYYVATVTVTISGDTKQDIEIRDVVE